jgi:hypothetical protein
MPNRRHIASTAPPVTAAETAGRTVQSQEGILEKSKHACE